MKCILLVVVLMFISGKVLGHWDRLDWSHHDGVSYQDLLNIGASCYPFDSCMEHRTDDPLNPYSSYGYKCSCNRQCWEIGTCCIDSPYRFYPPVQKCRSTNEFPNVSGYYMVHECPDNTYADSIWKNKCEKEWDDEDDILMLSPVTSLDTSATYKNYYCFRCHERTDNYVSWNLDLQSTNKVSGNVSVSNLAYNQVQMTWVANLNVDGNIISIPANLSFQYPYDLQIRPIRCDLQRIKDCPNTWTDWRVHDKCLAYTAVVYQGMSSYKNVHCALCNDVPLNALTCNQTAFGGYGGPAFTFRHLLNINDFDGDKVGSGEKCDNDHLWDPYSKKCRKKTCALPGYVIVNNRCAPP